MSDCKACSLTNVLFGLRLKTPGVSQEENVRQLLERLSNLDSNQQSVDLTFDRGYGKLPFIEPYASKGYDVTTVANTVGSRYPLISSEELTNYISRCKSHNESEDIIDMKVLSFINWIVDDFDIMGPDVRIAIKEQTKQYAFSL